MCGWKNNQHAKMLYALINLIDNLQTTFLHVCI